jgi:hypothetical protein
MKRINNPEACICCGRRADGLAVGRPGKLAWYCLECGPDLARIAMNMMTRDWDAIEKRAAEGIAQEIGGDLEGVPAAELPGFVLWVIEKFSESMRKQVETGQPPF